MDDADRAAQALAIRDYLLPLIRARGAVQRIGRTGLRMVVWQAAPFTALLRSPFTASSPDPAPQSHAAALAMQRAKPVLPWGLDVWHGRKVLSLQWDDAGRAEVISFNRGPWEDEALSLGPGQDLDPK